MNTKSIDLLRPNYKIVTVRLRNDSRRRGFDEFRFPQVNRLQFLSGDEIGAIQCQSAKSRGAWKNDLS